LQGRTAQCGRTVRLVDKDGTDQHRADHHLLPKRLHAENHEPVLQHRRDEQPDHRAED
jgi:hypothetical protein